jgi:hypothetical protein
MENKITEMFENLPLWAKILLLVVAGTLISPVYRILRYLETKNTTTLIVGIVCLVTGCGNAILAIIDIITEVTKGRITVLAD